MDNVTHTLFALTLARTPLGRAGRGTTAALVLASSAPDIDIVTTAGGGLSYLHWHRGPTHGLLGVVGLGVLTAGLVWIGRRLLDRSKQRAPDATRDASFGMLTAIAAVAIVLHILMDLPTSYGTRLLSPVDWRWFAFDWLPIVDIYLLAILGAALAIGGSAAARRRAAAIALVLMAANYGLRATAHHEALAVAPRLFGPLLPPPCTAAAPSSPLEEWPRSTQPSSRTDSGPRQPCLVEMAAMPTFLSPFRWRLIAQLSNAYELHEVDLLDARFRDPERAQTAFWRMAIRYPNQWTPAVAAAARTRVARVFLGFSRFPAARSFVDPTGTATVRWSDVRFAGGVFTLNGPRPSGLFTVTVRITPDGRVVQQQLGAVSGR